MNELKEMKLRVWMVWITSVIFLILPNVIKVSELLQGVLASLSLFMLGLGIISTVSYLEIRSNNLHK